MPHPFDIPQIQLHIMKAPRAYYECGSEACKLECTYPPDLLNYLPEDFEHWQEGEFRAGWYCDNCVQYFDLPVTITLEQYLREETLK